MISEKNYVAELFINNFSKFLNKKIALYGIGSNTEAILKVATNFSITGVMDEHRKSGTIFGMDIIDYADLIEKNVEMVVIIARASSTKTIYNRISDFCTENDILVYDIYANNLSEKENEIYLDDTYFFKNADELKNIITEYEAISFDVFDTLVMRRVLLPNDVFEIMGKKISDSEFARRRIECMSYGDNLNIYEIYDKYQEITGIPDEEKDRLIKLEMGIERSVIIPRLAMVDVFKFAVNLGKKVFLVSDMYMPKDILCEILEELDITGYLDVFISCDYRSKKSQGLYEVYKNNVNAKSYLHIGDNEIDDGMCAKGSNISTYNVKSGYEMLLVSTYKDIVNHFTKLPERIMLGMFVERMFNNPFSLYDSNGRGKCSSNFDVGYLFVAPIVTCFMAWMVNELKRENIDVMLFAARDGFLIDRLYSYLNDTKLPIGKYFLTSRFSGAIATSTDEEFIRYFASYSFDGKPEELLKSRFLLSDEDILKYNGEDLYEYVLRHKEKIYEVANKQKENYLKYITKLGIKLSDRIGFFDLASSGTTQLCVDRLLDRKMLGFYLIHIISDYDKKRELNISGLFSCANAFELQNYTFSNYLFLEYIFSSFEPSIKCFNNDGKPVFLEDNRNGNNFCYIKDIQGGIENYFSLYVEYNDIFDEIDVNFADKLFSFMDDKYTDAKGDCLVDIVLKNEFTNKELKIK